ncbi:MAG: hypothetical protein R3B70_21210, partial [Polyangiaceae bacterium]
MKKLFWMVVALAAGPMVVSCMSGPPDAGGPTSDDGSLESDMIDDEDADLGTAESALVTCLGTGDVA